jgi:hypothetical protein
VLFSTNFEKKLILIYYRCGPKTKTKYNELETWMQENPDWPTLSQPRIQKEKPTSPNKAFPFTVEVETTDDQALEKNFDFNQKVISHRSEGHTNAALVLNGNSPKSPR